MKSEKEIREVTDEAFRRALDKRLSRPNPTKDKPVFDKPYAYPTPTIHAADSGARKKQKR